MWKWIKALNPFESENYHPWMREELEAVKVERDQWKRKNHCYFVEVEELKKELAALRQPATVPVKVRWGGDIYDYDRLADQLSDGNQWSWNGMMVEHAFAVFAAHAVLDMPAGVEQESPAVSKAMDRFWAKRKELGRTTPHEPTGAQVEALARVLHKAYRDSRGIPEPWEDCDVQRSYCAEARAAFDHFRGAKCQ